MFSSTKGAFGLVACLVAGALFATGPSFSDLALLTVLAVGTLVGVALFLAPYPADPQSLRPARQALVSWLRWAVVVVVLEAAVFIAGDDFRWPTISALQDPLTSENPLGRFLGGAAWSAGGLGLVLLARRYRALGAETTRLGHATAVLVGIVLSILAATSAGGGPLLEPRNTPAANVAPTAAIGTAPLADWPITAWLTIAAFAALALLAFLIHRRGSRCQPPGGILDVLAWLMAPWIGRVLTYATWLWCGWHFMAR
jgi:hypothetical protein